MKLLIHLCSLFTLTHAFTLPESLPKQIYPYHLNKDIKQVYSNNDLTKIITIDNDNKVNVIENISPLITKSILDSNPNSFIFTESNPVGNFISRLSFPLFLVLGYLFLSNFNPLTRLTPPMQKSTFNIEKKNITLSDWAGSPEVKLECAEIVSYLENSTDYLRAGAEIPRGILLEGPPGTGKTLLAQAIANEAKATFMSISGSEFVELFVGLGAGRVRKLFADAKRNTPCIIFIDEIDAVGRQRGAGLNMGNDEREQTLNQLLTEMDGFNTNGQVIVIAATNRRDILDNALLRPGRFDRIISIPLPDTESRKQILKTYLKNKQYTNIDIDYLAEYTEGFSGAQLKNLVNEAAILTARNSQTIITQDAFMEALEKLTVGIKKENDYRDPIALKRVAIHELGHAFIASYYKEYFDMKKVTITSTYNGAGGYTLYTDKAKMSGLYTKDMLKKRLEVILGGKAAESVFYGEDHITLGAMQDLKQANDLARKMISSFGMGDKMKVFYEQGSENSLPFIGRDLGSGVRYSEKIKELIDFECLDLVNEAYLEAIQLIKQNKDKINRLIPKLIKNKELTQLF